MLKPVIAAATVLAIGGSSLVYAQQRFGGSDGYGDGFRAEHHRHFSADDIAAFTDARIAALKAGLELTPDQAKNWPSFEQALRDLVQLRQQQRQARRSSEQNGTTAPFDRLEQRADNLAKTSAALKRVADAGQPLYQSLNDAQKNRFTVLAHMLRPHRHMMMGWRQGRGADGWPPGDRRFGENNGGPENGMHRMMNDPGDQDSQL